MDAEGVKPVRNPPSWTYRALFAVVAVIAALAALPFAVFGCQTAQQAFNDSRSARAFDEVRWRKEPQLRYFMAQDLVRRSALVGLTEAEVRGMLGEPYHDAHDGEESGWLVYAVGRASELYVDFDTGETVSTSTVEPYRAAPF